MTAWRLVVFEGIDGSGKTTLVHTLVERCRTEGIPVLGTREPTDGPAGRRLRELARAGTRLPPWEELALFEADREAHTQAVVEPALREGRLVLQDRGFHSTAAYQGSRGIDAATILFRSRRLAPEPDLVVWLALPIEDALARARGRGRLDAFERRDDLERIHAYFASIPDAVRLDARLPPQQLADAAWSLLPSPSV
jgi:dTMP kinase